MLKMKKGCIVPFPEKLCESYEATENSILANVGIDKIEIVLQHFIITHDEPLFFILELPANVEDEKTIRPGVVYTLHKDIYYIDGCSPDEALEILSRVGELLYNDGISSFGFGGHESGDEIMFTKYNVLTIYSRHISKFDDFFETHDIPKGEKVITAWDTFSEEHPGISERYELDGKSVFDIPKVFDAWGIYKAEQREE